MSKPFGMRFDHTIFEWNKFHHIHFGRNKNWFIISSRHWHAIDQHTKRKTENNVLQVSILQRIGSIFKSEWKRSRSVY